MRTALLKVGKFRGVAQPGSALGLGPRGRRFESSRPDQVRSKRLRPPTLVAVSLGTRRRETVIEVQVDKLLKRYGRTFYWLAKETGISHTTLWRLKKGKALGINFDILEKICHALKCKPGEVHSLSNQKSDKNLRGRKNVSE